MKNEKKQQKPVKWLAEQIRNYKTPLNMAGVYFVLIHKEMINKFEKQAEEMESKKAFEIFKAGQDSMEEGGQGFQQYYEEKINRNNQ
jgi:hypothetical protein